MSGNGKVSIAVITGLAVVLAILSLLGPVPASFCARAPWLPACQGTVSIPLLEARDLLAEARERVGAGDLIGGRIALGRALEIYLEAGDPVGEAHARVGLGRIALSQGEIEEAGAQLEHARRIYRNGGARLAEARVLVDLADLDRIAGRYEDAGSRYVEGMAMFERESAAPEAAEALRSVGDRSHSGTSVPPGSSMGAMKWKPRRCTVWMKRGLRASSPRACRNSRMAWLRLAGVTATSAHTASSNSSLVSKRPGFSTRNRISCQVLGRSSTGSSPRHRRSASRSTENGRKRNTLSEPDIAALW